MKDGWAKFGCAAALALLLAGATACSASADAGGPNAGGNSGAGGSESGGSPATGGSSATGGSTATGGGGGTGGVAASIQWAQAPSMSVERVRHTATRLEDGRVLVVGGEDSAGNVLGSSEIFDPVAKIWSKGPDLSVPRSSHTAVLLKNGNVIVIGGGGSDESGLPSGQGVLDSTEIYDASANTFTLGPPLLHGRGQHQSALLDDGRVLVAGGTAAGGASVLEAETLKANGSAFSAAGSLSEGRSLFGLVRRQSGDVLVTGGLADGMIRSSSERFDPSKNTWSELPALTQGRVYLAIAPLSNGGVIAAGGIGGPNDFLISSEILDAEGSGWSAGPSFQPDSAGAVVGGSGVSMLGLENGAVLAMGGYGPKGPLYGPGSFSGELDESANAWVQVSSLDMPRGAARAVELADHRVMLIGGYGMGNAPTVSCSITVAPVSE